MENLRFLDFPVVMFLLSGDFVGCLGPFCLVCLTKAGWRRHNSATAFNAAGYQTIFLRMVMPANLAKIVKVPRQKEWDGCGWDVWYLCQTSKSMRKQKKKKIKGLVMVNLEEAKKCWEEKTT